MRILLMTLLLIGCQTIPKETRFEFNEEVLFPHGVYTQKVLVELKLDNNIQSYPFDGIMNYTAKNYNFVGLTFFGSTIFEASGPSDGSRPPDIQLYIQVPDHIQQKMDEINTNMLVLLKVRRNQMKWKDGILVYSDKKLKLKVTKTLKDGTPMNFMVSANDWHFKVRTTDYRVL